MAARSRSAWPAAWTRPTRASTTSPAVTTGWPGWAPRSRPSTSASTSITLAHVGDSRLYRLRDARLERLTERPHPRRGARPPGQAHARGGRRAPAAVDHHAGPGAELRGRPDTHTFPARAGDVYLICSDGLIRWWPRTTSPGARGGPPAEASRRVRRRRERRGRPGQHHGRALPPRGGADGAGAAETEQPTARARRSRWPAPCRTPPRRRRPPRAGAPSTAVHEVWRPSDAPVEPTGVVPRDCCRRRRASGAARQRKGAAAGCACRSGCPGHVPRRLRARRLLLRLADRLLRGDEPRRLRDGLPRAALRAAGGPGPLLGELRVRRARRLAGRPPARHRHGPQAALEERRAGLRAPPRAGTRAAVSARNRELVALLAPSLLLTAGFTALFIERSNLVSNVSLTYGAVFLGLCLAAHLVLRATLPDADPYLFPLVAGPGLLRPGDGLPDRRHAGPPAGRVVRHRAGPLRRDDPAPARLPRARALPLDDRGRLAAAPPAPARAGDRPAGQRRLPRRRDRPGVLFQPGVREDRDHRLPGELTCATRGSSS